MRLSALFLIAVVVSALAGCGSIGADGAVPRCDRNGDEDQRRAC